MAAAHCVAIFSSADRPARKNRYGPPAAEGGGGPKRDALNWERGQTLSSKAETAPDNAASLRVLEKCSFIPTGSTGEEGPRFVRFP